MTAGRPLGTARPPRRRPGRNDAPTEDDLDFGKGEKVARCAVCGVPERRSIVGTWTGDGLTYRIRVCARCIGKGNQPNPDPLTVAALVEIIPRVGAPSRR